MQPMKHFLLKLATTFNADRNNKYFLLKILGKKRDIT